jgi:hypothetical protein
MSVSLEDKLAIHELMGRVQYGYDERDTPMIENCFTEDAEFSMRIAKGDLIGPFVGREAIMGLMTGSMEEQTDVRRHVVSNLFFEEGDNGDPVCISNLTLMATENGEIQLLSAGVYHDTVVKRDGRWQILKRHLELDKAY